MVWEEHVSWSRNTRDRFSSWKLPGNILYHWIQKLTPVYRHFRMKGQTLGVTEMPHWEVFSTFGRIRFYLPFSMTDTHRASFDNHNNLTINWSAFVMFAMFWDLSMVKSPHITFLLHWISNNYLSEQFWDDCPRIWTKWIYIEFWPS